VYPRRKYRDDPTGIDWQKLENPVATKKYDGASFFVPVEADGSLRFFSRRPSVKGGFPERTEQLPHLSSRKLPKSHAGTVLNVELIHTGKHHSLPESHRTVSGILNSLPERSIQTQKDTGPVRAVILDVINPGIATFKDKLEYMKKVENDFGKPDLLFSINPETTKEGILRLIQDSKRKGEEGVIVTSLTQHEDSNVRVKVKNFDTFNLRVVKVEQEFDKNGNPKESMGSAVVADASGREVANVGSGWSRQEREYYWKNPYRIIGQLIQVKTMGLGSPGGRLRAPVYNGMADGQLDRVG